MIDIENYIGNEFKKNKLLIFVGIVLIIRGNGFNLNIESEQIDVVPFVFTMDIPEFRASCKLNGHNSNE
ncbi:hypothetical protein ACTFIY_009679 [Dictyostelium cf. discoideum]